MKKIVTSIILICLILTFSTVSVNTQSTINKEKSTKSIIASNTVYVDDDNTQGPWDGTIEHPYKTINGGINNSDNGYTVYVYSGIYEEYLEFNKSIKLIGEDCNSTIINGVESGIEASDIYGLKIYGFTLNNSVDIHLYRVSGSIICNNILMRSEIKLSNSSFNQIKDNIIIDSYSEAIFIWYKSEYNIISKNILKECARGVMLLASGNNSIVDNVLYGCGINVISSRCVISYNKIINMSGLNAIDIHGSDNTIVSGNKILNMMNNIGITVSQSEKIIITNNSVINISGDGSVSGIMISNSDYAIINNNTIKNITASVVAHGIYFSDSKYITVKDNIISNVKSNYNGSAIYLTDLVSQTTISKNILSNNSIGLHLGVGCRYNKIYQNTFYKNEKGICLCRGINNVGAASKNKIIANNISNSTNIGIYCEEGTFSNYIYYNNLMGNGLNAYDQGFNTWHKSKLLAKSKGNYWDDYTGVDNNHGPNQDIPGPDGIGDTPYVIDPYRIRNKDKYPVMNPFDIDDININAFVATELTALQFNLQSNPTLQTQLGSEPGSITQPYLVVDSTTLLGKTASR